MELKWLRSDSNDVLRRVVSDWLDTSHQCDINEDVRLEVFGLALALVYLRRNGACPEIQEKVMKIMDISAGYTVDKYTKELCDE